MFDTFVFRMHFANNSYDRSTKYVFPVLKGEFWLFFNKWTDHEKNKYILNKILYALLNEQNSSNFWKKLVTIYTFLLEILNI